MQYYPNAEDGHFKMAALAKLAWALYDEDPDGSSLYVLLREDLSRASEEFTSGSVSSDTVKDIDALADRLLRDNEDAPALGLGLLIKAVFTPYMEAEPAAE